MSDRIELLYKVDDVLAAWIASQRGTSLRHVYPDDQERDVPVLLALSALPDEEIDLPAIGVGTAQATERIYGSGIYMCEGVVELITWNEDGAQVGARRAWEGTLEAMLDRGGDAICPDLNELNVAGVNIQTFQHLTTERAQDSLLVAGDGLIVTRFAYRCMANAARP
jgi:hypothetical protein